MEFNEVVAKRRTTRQFKNGATLNISGYGLVGYESKENAKAYVYQTGGTVTFSDFLGLGNNKAGAYGCYNISGGTLSLTGNNGTIVVGRGTNSAGTTSDLIVSGTGSVTASKNLYIGENQGASGRIRLSDSGSISVAELSIARAASTTGTVEIAGGTLTCTSGNIGNGANSVAEIIQSGGKFYFTSGSNYGYMANGSGSTVTYTKSGGHFESNTQLQLAVGSNSTNKFYHTGGSMEVKNWFCIGSTANTGYHALFQLDGGAVTNSGGNTTLASCGSADSTAKLVVNGGELYVNDNIYVSERAGSAELEINGGTVLCANTTGSNHGQVWVPYTTEGINNGAQRSEDETYTLSLNGGTLNVQSIMSDDSAVGTATVNFNGGKLLATTTWGDIMNSHTKLTANIKAGGLVVETVNRSGGNTINSPLKAGLESGTDGGVLKLGAGTLTLGATIYDTTSTFTGPLAVSNGTLKVTSMTIDKSRTLKVAMISTSAAPLQFTTLTTPESDAGTLTLQPLGADGVTAGTTYKLVSGVSEAQYNAMSKVEIPDDDANFYYEYSWSGNIVSVTPRAITATVDENTTFPVSGKWLKTEVVDNESVSAITTMSAAVSAINDNAPNGYSYGWCYALGLEDVTSDKPALKATPNSDGTITLAYDGTLASGVEATVQSSDTTDFTTTETVTDGIITPSAVTGVKYYRLSFRATAN